MPPASRRAAERRRRDAGRPVHHGISAAVLPRPRDWRPELHLDEFWWPLRPRHWEPPPELVEFLAAGPPPMVVGFGSVRTAPDVVDAVIAPAARKAGLRLVVQAGSGGTRLGDDVLAIGDVPHDWLFPQAAVVVHHAGAGTTAAGLRAAGVPAVAVPVHSDQAFWAARIAALGAGPAAIPFTRLTSDRLAAAVSAAVENHEYRAAGPRPRRPARRREQRRRAPHHARTAVRVGDAVARTPPTTTATAGHRRVHATGTPPNRCPDVGAGR
ncbi:glycosyltransferase [Pseudonocardia nigra]|uniref:glycosyltransferase n=1 Tax=Pseudonocardia nigra TaxID=1921578 RepID=UPI001C5DC67C|nr:nucleotide disphospho-sugar-binding domain-containing protein [Pseudonocardia nigra]